MSYCFTSMQITCIVHPDYSSIGSYKLLCCMCTGMYSKMVTVLASIATIVFFFYYHHNTCCKKCSKHNLIAYVLKLFFVSYISSSAVTKK